MINTIFSFFAFAALAPRSVFLWVTVSLIAFGQVGQKTIPGIVLLLVVQTLLLLAHRKWAVLNFKLMPLVYAATLIILNEILKWKIPGFSYLVLSSSLDLWQSVQGKEIVPLKDRAFSLFSFPKTIVGPITSFAQHMAPPPERVVIFKVAFWGIVKAFILANLWREYVPFTPWDKIAGPLDYIRFGGWNYVNLYLEFSGACDLVAASFWLFGFGCPLNFDKPYLSLTVTEFWKRWHITLGLWIRTFVYIALGGSRVSSARILLNLMAAMILSGLWHGLSLNYFLWGALQGVFLCAERIFGIEQKIQTAGRIQKTAHWLLAQFLVLISWIVFFGRF